MKMVVMIAITMMVVVMMTVVVMMILVKMMTVVVMEGISKCLKEDFSLTGPCFFCSMKRA